jgi:hypothetical protein
MISVILSRSGQQEGERVPGKQRGFCPANTSIIGFFTKFFQFWGGIRAETFNRRP